MISTNTLSIFILHHHQNGICNNNIRYIEEIMRGSEPAFEKCKKVCDYFPIIAILTKSAMPGKVQLTFTHTSVGNKSLGESIAAFSLTGSLDSPSVVSTDINISFTTNGNKIHLLITEVLLCAAAGDLDRSKNQRDWTPGNAVLLLQSLTEVAIIDGGSDAGELLKIFARSVTERVEEGVMMATTTTTTSRESLRKGKTIK